MMSLVMKKSYETPETEVFIVKLDNFCETYTELSKMAEPEEL